MAKIKAGRIVTLSYLMKDSNGQILETNQEPIVYQHRGQHELFPEIENALEGKKKHERVTVTIKAKDAFGEHDPELTFTDDVENSPPEMRYIGAELSAEGKDGKTLEFVVTKIEDGKITIDANHKMAGKDLTFEVTVTDVKFPNGAGSGRNIQ